MNETEIIQALQSEGYDHVWVYTAEPNEIDEKHSHPYDTKLSILEGEIQIKTAFDNFLSNTVCCAGQQAVIPRNTPHEAKVGSKGCRYVVAEKH